MLANLGSLRVSSLAAYLGISLFLTACASPFFDVGKTETVLPLSRAWFDGKRVDYVTTDISDSSMAQMMGANHVPGLAAALKLPPGSSILQRVYKFADEDQIGIFQSAPQPIGAANLDRSYSPLWRVVMVKWRDPANKRELKSEEELLAAEERGQVTLTITDIVINCPITRGVTGHALRGVR
jgi:hypothetical protein